MAKSKTERLASAERQAVWQRNYLRARSRALTKLANLHPETYKQLLEQERKADEETGKTWLDISGATSLPNSYSGGADSAHANTQAE